ncbi:hypothetical protein NBZ79_11315 [Sneathiella marina]|uniref:Serine aminopeptidase S33 domain-containing protein n=1 Tax=Sneathiella marina TaxID=2950108 RepID=A0ABY4VXW7_9PROT|nr:hypothetical protein [Sneathiella marina]USG59766.1 hypothetical protein NBZ79_11315 [Sneathiella marina]
MTVQNMLILFGITLGLVVVACLVLMWLFYGNIYKFNNNPDTPAQLGLADIDVVNFTSEDGTEVKAWIKPPEGDAPVILYFMGNFTSIGPSVQTLQPFLEQGYGLAALVYRGSSGLEGEPSEAAFTADARSLYDQLDSLMKTPVSATDRLAFGYSLGSGIAVTLATERDVGGVILVAAYSRFCDYFTGRYYGLPFCYLMHKERYDSIDRINSINTPLLMLHGELDTAIDIRFGKRLFDAADEPKKFVPFENGTHVNILSEGLAEEVTEFYDTVIKQN